MALSAIARTSLLRRDLLSGFSLLSVSIVVMIIILCCSAFRSACRDDRGSSFIAPCRRQIKFPVSTVRTDPRSACDKRLAPAGQPQLSIRTAHQVSRGDEGQP